MSDKPIGIKDLIERVKNELTAPHSSDSPLFAVTRVELTVSFTAERNKNGGIDLQVIKAGADTKTAEVQTVQVVLESLIDRDTAAAFLSGSQREKALKHTTRRLNFEADDK